MPKRKASTDITISSTQLTPGGAKRQKVAKKRTWSKYSLGKLTGRIQPSNTTLAQCPGPFSGKKYVTFLYENALTQVAGAANVITANFKPNDMYDYDASGDSGNKQPLFFDTLLSASGPYKTFKVHSWKTTFTIINNSSSTPVDVFVSPPIAVTSEFDSLAEADNFPGVKRLHLTPGGGSNSKGSVTVYGHVKDVYPHSADSDSAFYGSYNTSPGTVVYQVVLFRGSDGTNAPIVYCSVKHEAFCELGYVDAIVS